MTLAKGSKNSPVYGKASDLSCLFLEEDEAITEETSVHLTWKLEHQHESESKIWKLYFDGANSKEGNGAGVLLVSLEGRLIPLSFKLEFEVTNNMVECEAFLLGLQTTKNLNIGCLTVYGDSEMVVRQIKNQCQSKHPTLRTYQNEVWDFIDNFFVAFNI